MPGIKYFRKSLEFAWYMWDVCVTLSLPHQQVRGGDKASCMDCVQGYETIGERKEAAVENRKKQGKSTAENPPKAGGDQRISVVFPIHSAFFLQSMQQPQSYIVPTAAAGQVVGR